ncbi:MAG TPA: GvpL/GvpF family gas vesicle protein [Gaiellaceae bacterium]|nr:GvpL/GvpF family gas vesicle protein [Gaiellaceae bacterium]
MSAAQSTLEAADPASAAALYCYGVAGPASGRMPAAGGVANGTVETVPYRDVAALVTPVASGRVRATRRDLVSHSDVLAAAFKSATVLPLRFGTVFDSSEQLVDEFLEPRYDELTSLLQRFAGTAELSVKAFHREEAVLAEIVRDNPRVARMREATRAGPDAATYPLRIELGELVAAELRRRAGADARALLDRLRPLALAVDVDDRLIEHQVLRAAFLVERKRIPAFDAAMDELARLHADRMVFKYLGPLPPHSFVGLDAGRR